MPVQGRTLTGSGSSRRVLGREAHAIQRTARRALDQSHGTGATPAHFASAASDWKLAHTTHLMEMQPLDSGYADSGYFVGSRRVDLFEMPTTVEPRLLFDEFRTFSGAIGGAVAEVAQHAAHLQAAQVALTRPAQGLDGLIERGIDAITDADRSRANPYAKKVHAVGDLAVQVEMSDQHWEAIAEHIMPTLQGAARFVGHEQPRNPVASLCPLTGEWIHVDFEHDAAMIARGWPLGRRPQPHKEHYRLVIMAPRWAGVEVYVAGPESDGDIGAERARIILQGLLSLIA